MPAYRAEIISLLLEHASAACCHHARVRLGSTSEGGVKVKYLFTDQYSSQQPICTSTWLNIDCRHARLMTVPSSRRYVNFRVEDSRDNDAVNQPLRDLRLCNRSLARLPSIITTALCVSMLTVMASNTEEWIPTTAVVCSSRHHHTHLSRLFLRVFDTLRRGARCAQRTACEPGPFLDNRWHCWRNGGQ